VDYDSTITTTTADGAPLPSFYGQMNEVVNMFDRRLFTDIFITASGRVAWAVGNNLDNTLNAITMATNYGQGWNVCNTIDNFRTISGTATGSVVWSIASGLDQSQQPYNVILKQRIMLRIGRFNQ